MRLYPFLSDNATAAFCHKVSRTLSQGWELYGSPTHAFNAARGVMRCGQTVVTDATTPYHTDMDLSVQ